MKKIIQSFCMQVLIFLVSIASLSSMEQNSVQLKTKKSESIESSGSSIIDLSTGDEVHACSGQDIDQSFELLQDDESPENKEHRSLQNIVEEIIAHGSDDPKNGRMLCTVLYLREQLIKLFTYEKISSVEELDSERYDRAYLMLNGIHSKGVALLPLEMQKLLEELDEYFELDESSSSFKSFSMIQQSRCFFASKLYSFLHELENFYKLGISLQTDSNCVQQMQSIEFLKHLNKIPLLEESKNFELRSQCFFSGKHPLYHFLDSKIIPPAFWTQFESPIQSICNLSHEILQSNIDSCLKISGLPDRIISPEQKIYLKNLSFTMSSVRQLKDLIDECKQLLDKDKELWVDLNIKSFIDDFIDQTSSLKQVYAHIYQSVFEKIHALNVSKFSFKLSDYAKDWFAYLYVNKEGCIQPLSFDDNLPKKIFCIETILCSDSLEQLNFLKQGFERNVLFVDQIIKFERLGRPKPGIKLGKKSKKNSRLDPRAKSFEQNLHDLIFDHLSQNVRLKDGVDEALYKAVVECDDLRCLLLSSGLILGKKHGTNPLLVCRYLPSSEKEVLEKDLICLQCTEGMSPIDIGNNDFLRLPDLYTRVVHAYYLERVQDRIKHLKKNAPKSKKGKKKKKAAPRNKKHAKNMIGDDLSAKELVCHEIQTQSVADDQQENHMEELSNSVPDQDSLIIVESELSIEEEKKELVLDELHEENLINEYDNDDVQSGAWTLVCKKKKSKKLSPYKKFIQALQGSLSEASDFFNSADEVISWGNDFVIINQPPSSFNHQIGVVLYLQEKNQVPQMKKLKSYARIRKAQNHIKCKKDNFHDFSYRVEDYLEFGHVVSSSEEVAHDVICRQLKKFQLPEDCYAIIIPGKLLCFNPSTLNGAQRDRILDQNQPGEPGVFAGAFVFIFKKHDNTCVHRCFHQAKFIDQEAYA